MRSLSWVLPSFLFLFSFAVMAPSVQACSGGAGDTIDRLLERTDIVVKARPVLVDSVRQNGILSVESYLVGGPGPSALLFVQNDPIIVERMLSGYRFGTCDFLANELYSGEEGYFFLARRPDGAYVPTMNWMTFPQPDSTIDLYDADYNRYFLTEDTFVSFIAEHSGEEATVTDASQPYPRYAPLKITTVGGKQYLLPIDSRIPIEVTDELIDQMTMFTLGYDSPAWNQLAFRPTVCPGEDCMPISPNGIYWLYSVDFPREVPAQAFLFSSTSDALAVWSSTDLTTYPIQVQFDPKLPPARSIPLMGAPETAGQAAWSPDGRQIAYSDKQGLWLVDVYAPDLPPRLLLPAEGNTIPLARAFSPLGRYLSIENGDTWLNLNLITGERLPSGLFSPNERLLLAFDPTTSPFKLAICDVVQGLACKDAGGTVAQQSPETSLYADQFMTVSWRDPFSFLALACVEEDMDTCFVDRRYLEAGQYWYDSEYYQPGTGFDYEPRYDDLVVITGEKQLNINGQTYDLSASLPEPIESVEWLPGLFYWR